MLKKIGLGLVVVVVAFAGFVATRPSTFRVERSMEIAAPADAVFPFINDFHQWSNWSPWEKLDPAMKKTFQGPAAGAGAIYAWTGNDKVGKGQMTVTDSRPNERVGIKLEFIEPWPATSDTALMLVPTAKGVKVTWAMTGNNNFMAKAASIFMNMDAMVGGDFEKGLAQLKTLGEAEAKRRADIAAAAAAPAPSPVANGSPAAAQ
jgi:uncharacterized protein YndB with AHSA1/START domain